MKQQKNEELERYKKENEMKKRFENQRRAGKKLVVKKVIKKPKQSEDS